MQPVYKRIADLVFAAVGGVLLAVVAPIVSIAIKLDSPGPVLFRHSRLGRRGRPFEILKFRTMVDGAHGEFNEDGSRRVSAEDARVTRIGRYLRGGLDELPQVLNVLAGDMSLVGPRPDDLYAVDFYEGSDWTKLAVRPGITGLSQASGRNDLPWKFRLRHDCYYAGRHDVLLDLRILIRTVAMAMGRASDTPLVDPIDVDSYAASAEAREAGAEIETAYEQTFGRPDPGRRSDVPSIGSPNGGRR